MDVTMLVFATTEETSLSFFVIKTTNTNRFARWAAVLTLAVWY